jgi:hypothetical protein
VHHDLEAWLPKIRPGGLLLLHDVDVRTKDFGVWKVWAELTERGRSGTFHDGPGLGVWQKPPISELPGFLELLLAPPTEWNQALAKYYSARADEMQTKIAGHWRDGTIRQTPFAQQTIIQIFYTRDGSHREEDSVYARIGHEGWKDVRIELPRDAATASLRIDFVSALTTIEIASIGLTKGNTTCFVADAETGFEIIKIAGDVEKLPDAKVLRLRVTGIDPQLYLPAIECPANEAPIVVPMRLRVL